MRPQAESGRGWHARLAGGFPKLVYTIQVVQYNRIPYSAFYNLISIDNYSFILKNDGNKIKST